MQFKCLSDMAVIRSTITHPKIYPYVTDFAGPDPDYYHPEWSPFQILYVGAFDDDKYLGLFKLTPQFIKSVSIHTCLLPEAYGSKALEAGKGIINWVFDNFNHNHLTTFIPESNRLALRFALKCGMKPCGFLNKAWQTYKEGKEEGVYMLQVERPIREVSPCQQPQ